MSKKVLVLGEIRNGDIRHVSFEAINAANLISEGGEVVALLFNDKISDALANDMIYYGASHVVKVEHPLLKTYRTDAYQASSTSNHRLYKTRCVSDGTHRTW